MNRLTVWINIALLDDEPWARQRLNRLLDSWSWEVSSPIDSTTTQPTLWAWLLVRSERDEFDASNGDDVNEKDRQKPGTTTRRLVRPAWGQANDSLPQGSIEPTSIVVKPRLVFEAGSPQEFDQRAAERVNARPLDIILSDVRLPGDENGVAFAARWQSGVQSPVVVMISAFEDSAIEAFNIDAADCVMKPVRAERLSVALCRALTKKAARESAHAAWAKPIVEAAQRGPGDDSVITVSSRGQLMNILVDDIVMFRSGMKYTSIRTQHREYLSETSISKFEQTYGHRFLKVHRNCLVAWAHVDGLLHASRPPTSDGRAVRGRVWYLKMKGLDDRIEISRRLWSVVAKHFNINPFVAYRSEYIKVDVQALMQASSAASARIASDSSDPAHVS